MTAPALNGTARPMRSREPKASSGVAVGDTRVSLPRPAPTERTAPRPTGRQFTDLGAELAGVGAPRRWLFTGIVEGAPLVVWAGPEKRDKSWTMIDAAVALATGGKWLGAFACERPGATIYLDGEYGPHEFARRLARVCRGRGVDAAEVAQRVHHYYSRDLSLDGDDEAAKWLYARAKELQPAAIFVDPWRNHLPGDENSAPDTLAALDICAQLRDRSGGAIFITHHLNKAGSQSGSRALLTRADLVVEGTDEEQPVYSARGRTIRRGDPITRRFRIAVEHDNDDDDSIACTRVGLRFEGDANGQVELTRTALRVLAVIGTQPIGSNDIRRATSISNGAVIARALRELADAGRISNAGGKWRLSTSDFFDRLRGRNEAGQ